MCAFGNAQRPRARVVGQGQAWGGEAVEAGLLPRQWRKGGSLM